MDLKNSYFDQKGYIKNSSPRDEKAELLRRNLGKNVIVKHNGHSDYILGQLLSVNLFEGGYELNINENGNSEVKRFSLGKLEFLAVER